MKATILGNRLNELMDLARGPPDSFDLFGSLNEIVKLANGNESLKPHLAAFGGSLVVFVATDTGRAVSLAFRDSTIEGRPGVDEAFDMKFAATEGTFMELLSGSLDPDSAFFRRRIRITGNIYKAMKFKNVFFSKILPKL